MVTMVAFIASPDFVTRISALFESPGSLRTRCHARNRGGDTFMFDVIDAGGLVFEDSLDTWARVEPATTMGNG